jgi:hypothetical protein
MGELQDGGLLMANFSASIPVALVETANAHLDSLGYGPNNFSIPASADGVAATHAGFHCWHDAAFCQAIQDMVDSGAWPGLTVTDAGQMVEDEYVVQDGPPNFDQHCTAQALEWIPQADIWHENPIMIDDERTFDGKLWVSLMDYNVWAPPIGWREVVAEGYPAWVQPVSSVDAYPLGGRVSFNGQNYESVIPANVWSPAVYPAGWKVI